jgi:putative oxidoreductase
MRSEDQPRSSLGALVRHALAVVAGAVFVYSGSVKLIAPLQFATEINNYQMLPWPVGLSFAFYLPWLEVLCGLALIFNRLFAGALATTTALMLLFLGATIAAKARGLDLACGCFGAASSNLSFAWHLVLDLGLLAALILLWLTRRPTPAPVGA